MQPLRPWLPRTLRLPERLPNDGSTSPCASATTSASLARSLLFFLRGLVQAPLGHLAPILRPWPPALAVTRLSPAPHLRLLAPKLKRLCAVNPITPKGSPSSV